MLRFLSKHPVVSYCINCSSPDIFLPSVRGSVVVVIALGVQFEHVSTVRGSVVVVIGQCFLKCCPRNGHEAHYIVSFNK